MKTYKAAVIGSGAGGAPAAAVLAEAWGDGVVILEAGRHHRARDFTQVEREMVPRLYALGGLQATEDGAVAVLQARTVGGSTVVNDAVCFRPPPELAERWRAYGVDLGGLDAHADRAEAAMGVMTIPKSSVNRCNYLLGLGAVRMGWAAHRLRHNSPGCVQCGFRHTGCAYDAKRSMNLAFVPTAVAAGAELRTEAAVHHLEREGGAWVVHGAAGPLARAERVVLCAGVVHTPAILLRSGFEAGSGVQLHLHSAVFADFDEPVDMFNGIPMSYGVLEFADVNGHTGPGYVIEGSGLQPVGFAAQTQADGALHQELLERYRHLAVCLCVVRSRARGTVRLVRDRPAVDYPLIDPDLERIGHFFERATEAWLAAGARRVLRAHRHHRWLDRPTPSSALGPGRFYCWTAHPFGGANRGSVTDGVGRVKGADGLWVLDASAIPEAPGVNPQITIASLALQGAERLLDG